MKHAPPWVNRSLYPFTSRWIEIDDYELHYIDEGEGDILLMVHGTPEWSFGYRDIVAQLKSKFRCIAIDLLGFGLSEKAPGEVYSCNDHALRLAKFIQQLGLQNISLLANDFGGSIGLHYAIHHPENIRCVMLFNTWMWSLKEDKHYARPAQVMRTWLGKMLYTQFNFPVKMIMPSAFGDKQKLTKEIHRHYKQALPDSYSRKATFAFAKELMDASPWWQNLWEKIGVLESKPMLLFWGMKDSFIQPYELEKWKLRFPEARVVTYADAGHFVQEEKPNEMAQAISAFFGK